MFWYYSFLVLERPETQFPELSYLCNLHFKMTIKLCSDNPINILARGCNIGISGQNIPCQASNYFLSAEPPPTSPASSRSSSMAWCTPAVPGSRLTSRSTRWVWSLGDWRTLFVKMMRDLWIPSKLDNEKFQTISNIVSQEVTIVAPSL